MNVSRDFISKVLLTTIFLLLLQACGGGTNSGSCCSTNPKLENKMSEVNKVVTVPEVKGDKVVYVDRNVTVIQYVDRNVTVIKYVDRNVTVDVIKVRPEATIEGLEDGQILSGNTLKIDGAKSDDVDGNVTKYLWQLDDINISTEKNPTIDLPTQEGTHKLCLIVTDDDNLTSKKNCKNFTIPHINQNPTATITKLINKKVKTKCPVLLSGKDSQAKDGKISNYLWMVDNNQTPLMGVEQNLSFPTIGNHKVCLTVKDTNDLNDTVCNDIQVNDHDNPTGILTLTDQNGKVMTFDTPLTRGQKYNFSCKGSHDDCNTTVPVTCKWSAHSFKIGPNGEQIDYVTDCMDHNKAPKVGENSWIRLCSSGADRYTRVGMVLEVTDQFGKTTKITKIFKVKP